MPRSYFYDGFRPDAPPLGYPDWNQLGDLVKIADDWTVWAFADLHGALNPFLEALAEAGMVDREGRWIGGPNVALVSVGDVIDRGPDSAGLVRYLRGLEVEMAQAGSRLVLVRGNHEQMLADILRGCDEWFDSWRGNGGAALARSYGLNRVAHDFSSCAR
jgi:serine/threonine protein phosphatase 1